MAENAALVQQAYTAFLRGDIPTVLGMLGPAVEWSVPRLVPQGGRFRGPEEVLTFFQGLGAAWNHLGLVVEDVAEVGPDRVVGLVRISGTLRGGAEVSYGAVHVFLVGGGCINGFHEHVDLDTVVPG